MKKIQYNSPVILTYVFLCCGVLLLDGITGGRSTSLCFCVYRSSAGDALTYVRLIGHVLGHADWQHFFNNVLYLLIVGPSVEEKYGSDHFPGLTVCAKSGTSQLGGDKTSNAMFAGFVMDEQYPLAFIVVVEEGGFGAQTCIPIISQILKACMNEMRW
mgnify:CR=1 FL=1